MIYNITKDWLIQHLLLAHGCMLLTYSITKAKRVHGDVAQFFAQHFDHCNAVYRCRQEYTPHLTTIDLFFYHNIKDNEINICLEN